MNATQRTALLNGIQLHDELSAVVSERTLEILERRRRTATVRRRGWLVRRMLLAADVVGLFLAFAVSEWIVNARTVAGSFDTRVEVAAFVASLPGWVVAAKLLGLYDADEERADHSTVDDFGGVLNMITLCTWIFWMVTYVTGFAHPSAPKFLVFWIAGIACVTAARASARAMARRSVMYLQNTVIVGAGDVGQLIAKKFLQHPEYGINLVGFIDGNPKERRDDLEHLAILGDMDRLPGIVRLFDVERVVVAFSSERHEEMLGLVRELRELDVQVDIVPRFFETVGPNARFHAVEGLPLVSLPLVRLSRSSALLKRMIDMVGALVGLIVLGPLMIAIAVAVAVDSRGPILYRHERVGKGRRRISVLKFRTMRREACRGARYGGADAEAAFSALLAEPARAHEFAKTYKLAADPRVTRAGSILRRLSLDELPQLFNVLEGSLSLVGPRAITADELPRYGERVDELLGVRPGITGYWQINGRSLLGYEDRVRLDLSYIRSWSLGLDLQILARTIRVLCSGRGAG